MSFITLINRSLYVPLNIEEIKVLNIFEYNFDSLESNELTNDSDCSSFICFNSVDKKK